MKHKQALKPEQIPELFVYYWNERNADGIASLFVPDAEFVNVVGLWWHNQDDIRKAHNYGLKAIFSESILKLTRVKVRNLPSQIAVAHARMRLSGQTKQGQISTPQTRHTIFTFVVQKEGSRWLCVAAHNTDVVPGKETNIVDSKGAISSVDYRTKM